MRKHVDFLTHDEERDLARRWRDNRDQKARDRIITAYQPLAMRTATRWLPHGLSMDDLLQEANVGMCIALDKFDPEAGVRFGTYASWWMRAQIGEAVISAPTIRPAKTKEGKSLYMRGKTTVPLIPLDAPLIGELTAAEVIPSDGPDPEEVASTSIDAERLRAKLATILKPLTDRERDIFIKRQLVDEPDTLDTIGHIYGISKERVRQIELKVFELVSAGMRRSV